MFAQTHIRIIFVMCAASVLGGCARPLPPEDPQAVVLTVTEAPDWAAAGATLEVRDRNDRVLLVSPVQTPLPILLDLEAPPSVHKLNVSLRLQDHEAQGAAEITAGYANCKVY